MTLTAQDAMHVMSSSFDVKKGMVVNNFKQAWSSILWVSCFKLASYLSDAYNTDDMYSNSSA